MGEGGGLAERCAGRTRKGIQNECACVRGGVLACLGDRAVDVLGSPCVIGNACAERSAESCCSSRRYPLR